MKNSMEQLKDLFQLKRQHFLALILTIPVVAVVLWLHQTMDQNYARQWDKSTGFWWILITAIIGLGGLIYLFRELLQKQKANLPTRWSWLALLGILLFFGVFAEINIETQHRVLSDESSWESMGLQMRYSQNGGVCNQGWFAADGSLECTDVVNNFKGKALSLVYWGLFHIFPPNRDTALQVNFWFYLGSLIFFFMAVFMVLRRESIALSATTLLAATPIYLLQSQSASTEVMYVLLLSMVFWFTQLVKPEDFRWKHAVFLIPLMGILAQTRQETIFCFLPVFFWYHPFFKRNSWNLPVFAALLIAACWPIINTIIAYRGYDFQGGEHDPYSLANFTHNMSRNISIMLNLEPGSDGLLKYPFSTTFTIWLMAATAWLTIRAFWKKQHVWGLFLVAAFHLQSLAILVNVSGTFDIDINQRYVLIALPSFALAMALFAHELVKSIVGLLKKSTDANQQFSIDLRLVTGAIFFISVAITLLHTESYRQNIMYRKNKLLGEEKYLHSWLQQNLPENAVYIYARPWQMLASGFNGFSERTLLDWSDADYQKWESFSGNHIYLVRGQDGYGKVNRKSRVVGFKTTTQIDQILNKFSTEVIHSNAKDFGYPLSIYKINGLNTQNKYSNLLEFGLFANRVKQNDTLSLFLGKRIQDTVVVQWKPSSSIPWFTDTLRESKSNLKFFTDTLSPGLHKASANFVVEDSVKIHLEQDWFLYDSTVVLATDLPWKTISQAWGNTGKDRSVENNSLTIKDQTFAFGFGTHAASHVQIPLQGRFDTLQTWVGLDDESACGDGAQFHIEGDGKTLWKSRKLYARELDFVKISVSGVQTLNLLTLEGSNKDCDHTNWANTWFK